MRVGVTGHQRLEDPEAWVWVSSVIDEELAKVPPPLVGVTSLAVGADQVFAQVLIRHRGALEAIIPFPEYEERFARGHDRNAYRRLLEQAVRSIVLPRVGSDEDSYYAAGRFVVDSTDLLLAVWDGAPAKGLGGTGDVVHYAEQAGKPVVRVDPIKRCVEIHRRSS